MHIYIYTHKDIGMRLKKTRNSKTLAEKDDDKCVRIDICIFSCKYVGVDLTTHVYIFKYTYVYVRTDTYARILICRNWLPRIMTYLYIYSYQIVYIGKYSYVYTIIICIYIHHQYICIYAYHHDNNVCIYNNIGTYLKILAAYDNSICIY